MQTYYIITDHLGTPQVLTDDSQAVIWQSDATPFGEEQNPSTQQSLRFPGQYADPESGYSYNYFRDYDPRLGRYVQSDPIGLGGGVNTYAYAYQNPLKYFDPLGLEVPDGLDIMCMSRSGMAIPGCMAQSGVGGGSGSARPSSPKQCPPVINGGAKWNNGWRTADGKFASPNGPAKAGAAAEQKVWDAVKQKPGWSVIEGRVSVRNADGHLRVYDGAAVSPRGRVIGLEVKSGSATKTGKQRNFDGGVNTYNPAVGVGNSSGVSVGLSLEIRVP